MTQRVLVTGAGGFLGRHICRYFGERGYLVAAVGRFSTTVEGSQEYPNLWRFCGMTLPDQAFVKAVREFQPTLVVHAAGTASVPDSVKEPYRDFQNTVEVCAFVLETLRRECPDAFFVLLSSASVYGNPESLPIHETAACRPISPYGYHKRICELLAEEYRALHGLKGAILRIFSAYGEHLRKQVVYDLCRKISEPASETVEVYGTGNESRDFIHAEDVAQAIERIAEADAQGTFNVASGSQTTIRDLIGLIQSACNVEKRIDFSGEIRQGDPLNWQADISRLARLGFRPRMDLPTGVDHFCRWYLGKHEV
ncbi:GDP-6-deoxy-D-mannose reductase [compost metagenome]